MSDNTIAMIAPATTRINQRSVIRYAAGSAIVMLVAMGLDYSLAYLTPVLALGLLAPGTKAPGLKTIIAFILIVAVACFSGVVFSSLFIEFPLVLLPLLSLIIFLLYYTELFQPMKVWMIISLLLIPMLSMESPAAGSIVAMKLFINAVLAIFLVTIVYFIFPQKETSDQPGNKPAVKKVSFSDRFIPAIIKTVVVVPVIFLFFIFSWSDSLLILVFIAILSMNPAASNRKAGMGIIIANIGGGLVAIVAFNLLTVVPVFLFMGMLTFLAGLILGRMVFSGKPAAPLFGMGFSTFLLILGSVTSIAGEAGEKVWSRVFQLSVVVIYIVFAFRIAEKITEPLKKKFSIRERE